MKGKRANISFVSEFMTNCVKNGITTPEKIVEEAKRQIELKESKILEGENAKVDRSNLLDVVESFSKGEKKIPDEAKKLDLFQIEKPEICRIVCDLMKNGPIMMSSLNSTMFDVQDLIFCVKQLIQFGVIGKTGDVLVQGDRFEDYVNIMIGKVI